MGNFCKRLFIQKKKEFDVEGKELLLDFKQNLCIDSIKEVRIVNRYDIIDISKEVLEASKYSVFAEKNLDNLYEDSIDLYGYSCFAVEYLPGQYDQRSDAAEECIEIISEGVRPKVKYAKIICIKGNIKEKEFKKIKDYYINPVDSRETIPFGESCFKEDAFETSNIENIKEFINMNDNEIEALHKELNLAMSLSDLKLCKEYFVKEKRNPTYTEIAVIDTYWSDHCRHTTFSTSIKDIEIEENIFNKPTAIAYDEYIKSRNYLYEKQRDINLMDIATIAMKEMKKRGDLKDLDESDEINACTIKVNIDTTFGIEEYLISFKNETHNHPTEIEPFGGAATCLGGAIRDPLSGRTYVYQAMRVTGSGDPRKKVSDTLKGKLPQRKITLGAAKGYSSYGNQIGLSTGQVTEVYHEGFVAKRMEIGAVIGAAPSKNVRREKPLKGDVILLLGGRTGRDGCGGATGSSKKHTEKSINICGAEVQKGNAPTERKLQRFFRREEVAALIKKCNDFGAGGVAVAIGELCSGIDINLDKVPKKYEGLTGTELAISESQERMAVVVEKEHADRFIKLAEEENIESTKVAEVTELERLRMFYKGEAIVDIKRDFLDSNGAKNYADVFIKAPVEEDNYFNSFYENSKNLKEKWISTLSDLNICSQKGLAERFDSTIGSGTVLMPFGGKYQMTPGEGMVSKIPVLGGDTKAVTIMSYGYNPYIGTWSPFHGALYSIVEAVAKIACLGGDYKKVRLTLQEYFQKLGEDKEKWGKPFSALLGALYAQKELGIAAIGGKDSMSGSFEQLDVPPTLVAFGVAVEKDFKNIISQELKLPGHKLILLKCSRKADEVINFEEFKQNLTTVKKLADKGNVYSAMSIKHGGLCEALSKMSFGNRIGVKLYPIDMQALFSPDYGSIVLEIGNEVNVEESFNGLNYKILGITQEEAVIEIENEKISIEAMVKAWEKPLQSLFPSKTKDIEKNVETKLYENHKTCRSISTKLSKPTVFIPVFPGTNCEFDSIKAFENQGAKVNSIVFKNLNRTLLKESIEIMKKEIKKAQIVMIPGGFSAGDEPEGSGKFIATVFRNPYIKEAVMELLKNRDGLMLGICNGFQALIKLGLVPYGEIIDIEENMPTLTYNSIGRHVSTMVQTKVVSNLSPWFNEAKAGDIHTIPVSHGEGRFVAPEGFIKELISKGQVATQYVDFNGDIALDMPFNPNGSMYGIEGITSPDGRVLGKMGHSERIGEGLYKNICGEMDQKIFKSGVNYFK